MPRRARRTRCRRRSSRARPRAPRASRAALRPRVCASSKCGSRLTRSMLPTARSHPIASSRPSVARTPPDFRIALSALHSACWRAHRRKRFPSLRRPRARSHHSFCSGRRSPMSTTLSAPRRRHRALIPAIAAVGGADVGARCRRPRRCGGPRSPAAGRPRPRGDRRPATDGHRGPDRPSPSASAATRRP